MLSQITWVILSVPLWLGAVLCFCGGWHGLFISKAISERVRVEALVFLIVSSPLGIAAAIMSGLV